MSKILFPPTDQNGVWLHHSIEEDDDGRIRIRDASDECCWLDFTRPIVFEDADEAGMGPYHIVPVIAEDGTKNAVTTMGPSRALALAAMFNLEIRTDDGHYYRVVKKI